MPSSFRSRRLLLTALLTACAAPGVRATPTFPFIPDHYTFSREQVQGAIARKFPYEKRVAQLFEIRLTDPTVGLRPETNRIAVTVNASISSPLTPAPIDGRFTLTSQIVYDATASAVVLHEPRVEQVDFPAAAGYGDEVNAAAGLLAAQLLADYPIYRFKPDQLSFAGISLAPGTITVVPQGVRVQIVER
jgi:hypothetical protein